MPVVGVPQQGQHTGWLGLLGGLLRLCQPWRGCMCSPCGLRTPPHPVAAFPSDGLLCSLGRRHTPYGNQTDYRIFELNKRLQNWTEVGSWEREGWPGQYSAVGAPIAFSRMWPWCRACHPHLRALGSVHSLAWVEHMAAVPDSQCLSVCLSSL